MYRLSNYKDLETFVEELSAITDKATILQIYNMATAEPYSFLYVNLRAKAETIYFTSVSRSGSKLKIKLMDELLNNHQLN